MLAAASDYLNQPPRTIQQVMAHRMRLLAELEKNRNDEAAIRRRIEGEEEKV